MTINRVHSLDKLLYVGVELSPELGPGRSLLAHEPNFSLAFGIMHRVVYYSCTIFSIIPIIRLTRPPFLCNICRQGAAGLPDKSVLTQTIIQANPVVVSLTNPFGQLMEKL